MAIPKVLYITRKYPPEVGGMENFSYQLYKNFDDSKITIDLIALGKSQNNLIWFFPYALIKTLLTAKKYDIVFVGDAVLCLIGFLVKLCYPNIKVVINVFGLDITYANPIYRVYLKLFYKKFDKYISISEATDYELKKMGVNESIIITPGIDVSENIEDGLPNYAFREKYNISTNDIILITVGRLVKRKGVEWFVRNVVTNLTEYSLKYLVVGTGDDKERIEQTINECNLEKNVQLLGRVSDKDLKDIYKNADIFVMPNIKVENDMEGFGIVAAEASLAGLTVMASGIEGICDAIKNEKNGYLLESENSSAYCELIKDYCSNSDMYKEKTTEFQQYTMTNYSWGKICDKYVKLFNELLNK